MDRGSIHWVNLSDASPPEMGKVRPGIIVSNSGDNLRLPTVMVIPLSTKPPHAWPFRVEIKTPRPLAAKRQKQTKSFAVVPGLRQVAKKRLESRIGRLDPEDLRKLDEAMAAYLSD